MIFSTQKDTDCLFSMIRAPSVAATCRITLSECYGLGLQVLICRSIKYLYGFAISILGDTPDLSGYDPERPDLISKLGIASKLALL